MAEQNRTPSPNPQNSGWRVPMRNGIRAAGNHFWKFRNAVAEDGTQQSDTVELVLYGDISQTSWFGDEVTPAQFDAELRENSAASTIVVRINSGGGDIFAAQTIGTRLKDSGKTTIAKIDGLCASAATVVACYCDKVIMANGGNYMAHLPAVGLCGYYNENELAQYESACKKIKDSIIAVYMAKCKKPRDEVEQIINATTWWNAQETVDNGFADELMFAGVEVAQDAAGIVFVNRVPIGIAAEALPDTVKNALQAPAAAHFLDNTQQNEREVTNTMANNTNPITSVDDLRREYPDLCRQIESAAAENATNAERTRIRDLDGLTVAGAESVINAAKYEKPATAADTALQIVSAMKANGTAFMADRAADAKDAGVNAVPPADAPASNKGSDEFADALGKLFPKQ